MSNPLSYMTITELIDYGRGIEHPTAVEEALLDWAEKTLSEQSVLPVQGIPATASHVHFDLEL